MAVQLHCIECGFARAFAMTANHQGLSLDKRPFCPIHPVSSHLIGHHGAFFAMSRMSETQGEHLHYPDLRRT